MVEEEPLRVKIKRIDKELPLPKYETGGSVFFDLRAREKVIVPPREIRLIPLNIVVETPPGYMLVVSPRSSTPLKKGLMIPQGIGVVDQDYCGEEDEVALPLYNFTEKEVIVEKGDRIIQAGFVRVDKAEWIEVEKMERLTRGGFGSTGEK